jgi:hypothetical protein
MHNVWLKNANFSTDRGYSKEKPLRLQQHRGTAKEYHPHLNACLGESVYLALGKSGGATGWRDWYDM